MTRVLSIGTDRKLFEENSPVRQRQAEYGNLFEELHIIVFSTKKLKIKSWKSKISNNVWIYPTNSSSRLFYIIDAYKIGKKIIENYKLEIENSAKAVISAQDPFETGLVAYLLARKFHLPFQLQIHTDFFSRYFKNSFLNRFRLPLARFLIPHAQSLRVTSHILARSLETNFHDLTTVPEVLPIFVDLEKIASTEPSRNLRKEFHKFKNIILMVSRLSPEKRIDVALHAFKKVLDRFPETGLIIVGDGKERKNLEYLAKSLGLSNDVAFIGWQNDVISLYKSADLFLLTSEYEGYGMTLIEAGASGLAIVSTEVGIAKDKTFKDGLNCYICPVSDVVCLSEGMFSLLSDKEKQKSFALSIQQSLRSRALSKSQHLSQYAGMLDNLTESKINHSRFSYAEDFIKFLAKHVIFRYLLSGGTAGLSLLFSLFVFNSILHIHYLLSAVIAFVIAFLVSFTLHRFWTFRSHEERIDKQATMYLATCLIGLSLNTLLLYIFVDYFNLAVILSQIIVGLMMACISFFVSRKYIFKYREKKTI